MTQYLDAIVAKTAPLNDRSSEPICILICQHRTCKKQGAAKIFATFRTLSTPEVTTEGCGCLGNCGNGPMVLVLPSRIWYYRVHPQDVSTILRSIITDRD
jgi:(2Fe-2S) ferredoxin